MWHDGPVESAVWNFEAPVQLRPSSMEATGNCELQLRDLWSLFSGDETDGWITRGLCCKCERRNAQRLGGKLNSIFCAKCCQQSDYKDLPMILANGEEVALGLACKCCKFFVPDDLLIQHLEHLRTHRKTQQRKNWLLYDQHGKTTEPKKQQGQLPGSNESSKMLHSVNVYPGASNPGQLSLS